MQKNKNVQYLLDTFGGVDGGKTFQKFCEYVKMAERTPNAETSKIFIDALSKVGAVCQFSLKEQKKGDLSN